MKTTLVCTLLVCCLCLGAHAEDKKLNDGLSSIQARKPQLGTQGLQTPKRKLTDKKEEKCTPQVVTFVHFKREGEVKLSKRAYDRGYCVDFCKDDMECVAINFKAKYKSCEILTSATKIVRATDWVTEAVRFHNNDPCGAGNTVVDRHKAGGDYNRVKALSPYDCCRRCVADQPIGCFAWDYQSESKRCYLKKRPIHRPKPATRPGLLFTGFACHGPEVSPHVVV